MGISWRLSLASLILRLSVGGMLLLHGIQKIRGGAVALQGIKDTVTAANLPEVLAYGVYVGEVAAPILLILGLFVPVAGLLIAINMALAVYLAHQEQITQLNPESGSWAIELQMLYLAGGLACAILGAGKYSLWYPMSRSLRERRAIKPVT
jgi:putative oxidoreductase